MTKARDLANSAAAFASVSATELGYVDGVTSAIQTQMDAKAPSSTAVTLTDTQTLTNKTLTSPVIASVINNTLTSTTGDIIYASAANTPARLGIGSSAQVLTVASGIPSWATPASGTTFVGAKAYRSGSGQSVPTATQTLMEWNAEFYDTDVIHDNSTNPSRFTVPTGKSGYWLVQCHIGWPASSGTIFHEAVVFKNGATFPNPNSTTTFYGVGFTGRSHQVDIAEIMYLSAADYIQFYVQQNSGGTVNTTYVHTQATWASITFLGA